MKKVLFSVCAGMLAALQAMADTETVGDYTWTYYIYGDTATICNDEYAAISPGPTGAVTIPSTLGGKPVTRIGYHAFYYCSGLTSVTIPDSVTSIDSEAFSSCSGLTSVTIPDSVMGIWEDAFKGCSESLFDTTTIPGVKLVDGWAVGHTGSLSGDLDLTGARGIGHNAFSGCSGLTSVTIPDSVKILYDEFEDCNNLNETIVHITDLGGWCTNGINQCLKGRRRLFVNGVEISEFHIPEGVTSIVSRTFDGCSGLTSVTIPSSVTNIGEGGVLRL